MEMMKIMQDIRQFCSLHVKRSPKGGISSAQELDLLSRLHLSENPLTPHSLCEKMGISRPLASRLIENLEMKGFLEKEVSEADKRSYFLRITELGSRELKGTYAYYLEPVYLLRTQMGGREVWPAGRAALRVQPDIGWKNSSHRLTGRMRAEAEGNCSCCLNCYGRSSLFRLKGRDFI